MQDIYTKAILKCCSEKTKESGPHSDIPLPSQIIPKSKIFLSIILLKAKGHEKRGPPSTHPPWTCQGLLRTAGAEELCISCLSFQLEVVSK